MSRPSRILLAVVAVLVLGIAALAFTRMQQHELAYEELLAAHDRIATTASQASQDEAAFSRDASDAEDAGQKRHDNSVAGDDDINAELVLAKRESTDVDKMLQDETSLDSHLATIIDGFRTFYGEAAAQHAQTSLETFDETSKKGLGDGQRAIDDVKDELEEAVRGSEASDDPNIETYYHESDLEGAEAARQQNDVQAAIADLVSRLASDLQAAQARRHSPF